MSAQPMDVRIEHLGLSTRSCNAIRNMGIVTVGEIIECTGQELLQQSDFGSVSLRDLESALAVFGLRLADHNGPLPLARRRAVPRPDSYRPEDMLTESGRMTAAQLYAGGATQAEIARFFGIIRNGPERVGYAIRQFLLAHYAAEELAETRNRKALISAALRKRGGVPRGACAQ